VNKFLKQLELINTNVESARDDLHITHGCLSRYRRRKSCF